jgi:RNA polymerase sigma-70 factor (ECF subfamily)
MSLATADLPLLPLVAVGDEGAMRQLVRRFTPYVRGIAHRTGAAYEAVDDVVQETMLRLWRSAHRFDPDRGTEPTFIAAVARNAAIDLARREACRPAVPSSDALELAPPPASASEAERVATVMTVRAALRQLPPAQRELLRLAYFEQLTQDEIATRLGLPVGTVKSRTFHAFRCLRAIIGDDAPAAA